MQFLGLKLWIGVRTTCREKNQLKKRPYFLHLNHSDPFISIKAGSRRCNVKASPLQDGHNLNTVTKTPANRIKEPWNPPNENRFPISPRGTAPPPGEKSSKKPPKQASSRKRKRIERDVVAQSWEVCGCVGVDVWVWVCKQHIFT